MGKDVTRSPSMVYIPTYIYIEGVSTDSILHYTGQSSTFKQRIGILQARTFLFMPTSNLLYSSSFGEPEKEQTKEIMEIFGSFKELSNSLMRNVDNGRFFIKPQKWLYFINGIIAFIFPLVVTYLIIDNKDLKYMFENSTWNKFVGILAIILFLVFMYYTAYITFLFWVSRMNNIDVHVKEGDNMVAIPLYAHYIQSYGEFLALNIGLIPSVGAVLLYLFLLLTGEANFYHDRHFLTYFLILVLVIIALVVGAWAIAFISHFISECIRVIAQIANDLRDVRDIHHSEGKSIKDGSEKEKKEKAAEQVQSKEPETTSNTDMLKDLKSLLDAGILSQEEYEVQKKELLNS